MLRSPRIVLRRLAIWQVYLILAGVLFVLSFFIPRDTVIPVAMNVPSAATASLNLIDQMTKLVATLNTTMVGAAAAIALKGRDWNPKWATADAVLVTTALVAGAASYFGVYLSYVRLLTMIYQATLNPFETGFAWALRIQYYGVIFGFTILGLVFARMLDGRRTHETPG